MAAIVSSLGSALSYLSSKKASADLIGNILPSSTRNIRHKIINLTRDLITEELRASLHLGSEVEIDLEFRSDLVDQPQKRNLMLNERGITNKHLSEILDMSNGELLIIGEAGSGKTILLYQLAEELLKRAEKDSNFPVPMIFSLSSWNNRQETLETWLIKELKNFYNVPIRIGETLIKSESIIPVLDNLDKVKLEFRETCINAINEFRESYFIDVLVSCRTSDYQMTKKQLKLNGSIVLRPLTIARVISFLEGLGRKYAKIKSFLAKDKVLQEIISSPLMVHFILVTPIQPLMDSLKSANKVGFDSQERYRYLIYENFTEYCISKVEVANKYSRNEVIRWLSWLAQTMKRHNLTSFFVERIQPSWSNSLSDIGFFTALTWFIYGTSAAVITLIIPDLLHSEIKGWQDVFTHVLLPLLVSYLFAAINIRNIDEVIQRVSGEAVEIPLFTSLRWRWKEVIKGGLLGLLSVTILFSLATLIAMIITIVSNGNLELPTTSDIIMSLKNVKHEDLGLPVYFVLFAVLSLGLRTGGINKYTKPNEAIWQSGKNSLLVGLLVVVALSIINIDYGLLLGLWAVMVFGGASFIKHFVVRFLLYRSGKASWNMIKFLDSVSNCYLMKRVGCGYSFFHAEIMDYISGLKQFPNDGLGLLQLANRKLQETRYDQCIMFSRQATVLDPSLKSRSLMLIGLAHLQQGDKETALLHFEDAVKEDPNDIELKYLLMIANLPTANKAREKLDEFLREYPNDINFRALSSVIFHDLGQIDKAISECRYCLRLDGKLDPVVKEVISSAYEIIGTWNQENPSDKRFVPFLKLIEKILNKELT